MSIKDYFGVGGPQVDPGFVGPLHCPLFNMSNKPVKLRFKDHIVTIDFVKTTPKDRLGSSKYFYEEFQDKIKIKEIEDYVREELSSAVEEIAKQSKEAIDTTRLLSSSLFIVLSIIITALTIIAIFPYSKVLPTLPPEILTRINPITIILLLGFFVLSLGASSIFYCLWKILKRWK